MTRLPSGTTDTDEGKRSPGSSDALILDRCVAPSAVLFDIGGTLLEERYFDLEAGMRAVLGDDPGVIAELARTFRTALDDQHRMHREILLVQWLTEQRPWLRRTAGAVLEDAIWKDVVTLVPRPGMREVLERLREDHIPMAAVSNAAFSSRSLAAELERHGLQQFFRFILSSADVGFRKPHPTIFAIALAQIGVRAEHTWFVGDTLHEDILGASSAGLWPIWLFPEKPVDGPAGATTRVRDAEELLRLYTRIRGH